MPVSPAFPAAAVAESGARRPQDEKRADALSMFGLLPLLISMPLMFWPKIVEGDTQPWPIAGAAIAFLFYWPYSRRANWSGTFVIGLLTFAAIAAYWLRGPDPDYFLRYAGIMGALALLWDIAARGPGAVIGRVVRITIVLWFVVGVYQIVAIRLGLPLDMFGRYIAGRGGVPSLTPESSYYGSISVLLLMYLITDRRPNDKPYIAIAALNVLLSGSLLSLLLLLVPLFRLPLGYKITGVLFAIFALIGGLDFTDSGLFNRIASLDFSSLGTDILLRDASINLRAGHIWFTMVENLPRELTFSSLASYYLEYNHWALSTGTFIVNGSDAILPLGGELLFRSGLFGLLIILFVLREAWKTGQNRYDRWEKLVFVIACFLNPLSFANPFFIFYIHKRYGEP